MEKDTDGERDFEPGIDRDSKTFWDKECDF